MSPRSSRARRRAARLDGRALFSVIIGLYLSLTTIVAAEAAHLLHQRSRPLLLAGPYPSSTAGTTPKYLVLIVLDGARPDYLDVTALPHVDALRASGTEFTNAILGILEAETPAGHATIASGSRPDRSGILGFDWAGDTGRYSLFSPDQMNALEQIMRTARVPTIAGLYKQAHPGARAVAISGHKYYAAAPLGGPAADAILYYQGDARGRYVPVAVPGHVPPASLLASPDLVGPTTHLPDGGENRLATRLALRTVTTMHPRILLINYPEFDWPLGHVDGGSLNPSKVKTDMAVFDADLGKIEEAYQRAGILNQTLFVITADHGMMPITRFVPASVVNDAVTRAGTTAPDIASGSGEYIWLTDPQKARAVAENVMAAHDPGVQSAYYLATMNGTPRYLPADPHAVSSEVEAANQYLLGALLNGHQPAVVVFGREGASFSDPKTGWKGDHGGSSWQSQHVPLILAGPGIRSGVVTSAPVQLEDLAPTVLTAMGVRPAGMEGTVLVDALADFAPPAAFARADEVGRIGPVLSALSSLDQ